jgi:hypothetical protein
MYVSSLYYITVTQEQIKGIIAAVYVHFQRNVLYYTGKEDCD